MTSELRHQGHTVGPATARTGRRASPAPVLELAGVSKRWGDLVVLDVVDLVLLSGQRVRLSGENGVGKTTLLRIASGLILPEGGSVTLDGLRPDRDRRAYHQRLGYLAAGDRGVYARLTVRQNLEFAAGVAFLHGAGRREAAVAAAIARFELQALERRRADRLSMGQRQRLRLALTFLHEPDVVLLDEPRSSLDSAGLALLTGALDALVARGGTALWCAPTGDDDGVSADAAYLLQAAKVVRA
ncbi:MAG: ABC transporter ATP-binding protein [Acidimicrobiales bacterium]